MSDVKKIVEEAIADHCLLDDKKHEEIKDLVVAKFNELSMDIKAMAPTVQEVKDFQTFWQVGKRIGLGLVFIITAGGVISGALYAIKEWIKK